MLGCGMVTRKYSHDAITEFTLYEFSTSESGWVGANLALSDLAIFKIRESLSPKLTADQIRMLLGILQRGYPKAVEMALFQIRLRDEVKSIAEKNGQTKRPPAKLGVILRDYIRNLRNVVAQTQRGDRRVHLMDFLPDIESFPVLERLITFQIEADMKYEIADPLRNAPEQSAERLAEVLKILEQSIVSGLRSGPVEPALNFLAWVYVTSFRHVTGAPPGRIYDPYQEVEKGAGLEICRLMAADMYSCLPKIHRPTKPADMVKAYRNAIKRARDEDRSKV
jgi:hypothetical protein